MAQKSSWNMYYNCMQESELSEVTLTHHQVQDTIATALSDITYMCHNAHAPLVIKLDCFLQPFIIEGLGLSMWIVCISRNFCPCIHIKE